ncbi:hypothetical protein [Azorhizobium caulinodans]|uniref:hypothetical protein n=1 Tax=Azorhizobium caulinodans TaxID=7 RepID=UPI002FBECD31
MKTVRTSVLTDIAYTANTIQCDARMLSMIRDAGEENERALPFMLHSNLAHLVFLLGYELTPKRSDIQKAA